MKLKQLWIKEYNKYHNQYIVFDSGEDCSELQKVIFGKMNITLFSGENGSGKTTILSFISYIFRFIQRFRERVPSDYALTYEIKMNRKAYEVTLLMEEKKVYILINGEKFFVQEYRVGKDKGYRIDKEVKDCKQLTYDDIRKYLPTQVYVLGFDFAYHKLSYGANYIGEHLVEYRDISSTYGTTCRGSYNSKGILYLYYMFVTNVQLRNMFSAWGLELSDYVDVHTNIEDLSYIKRIMEEEYFSYPVYPKYRMEEFYIEGQKMYRESGIENYIDTGFEDEYDDRFLIVDYLKSKNKKGYDLLKELIDRRIIYINEFYINKGGKNISIDKMSTGEKAFLFDLFAICSKVEDNSIIIWEEPETHLNMKWSKNLVPLLTELFSKKDVQWLFSSHSSYMIKNLFQNQILRLKDKEIANPDFNTFLANDTEIFKRLFEDTEINLFEKKVINRMKKGKNDIQSDMMNALGESYLKFMLFKTWEN